MRHQLEAALLSACMVLAPAFAFIACAGTSARTNVMLPAIGQSWSHIRVQCMREADAAGLHTSARPVVADADAAVATGDVVAMASVDWPVLDALAEGDVVRRLASQAIGPITAESLRARLAEFIEARALYIRRIP